MTDDRELAIFPPTGPAWEAAKVEANWLAYRLIPQDGRKPKKVPQSTSGRSVGPKEAAHLTFEKAQNLAKHLGSDCGIGYLPRAGSALVCVDFDGIIEDGGVVQPDLPSLNSYSEISPSGTGLHVLVARPTDLEPTTFDDGEDWVGLIASDSKFFTVTMQRWGEITEITSDRNLIEWVLERERPSRSSRLRRGAQQMDPAEQRQLQQLQLADEALHWFYQLEPAARAKCAREMLAVLPPKFARNYDTWIKAGMALKLADYGYELLDVWDEWSATASNYDGKTQEKWCSFSEHIDEGGLNATIRTVISWAKKHGWDPATWEYAAAARKSRTQADAFRNLHSLATSSAEEVGAVIEDHKRPDHVPEAAAISPSADMTRPGGLVEALIDFGAARSPRASRLPALAGALAATSALTNRNYIIETPGFLTSPGLQVVLVSETGTGKETARDVIYAVSALRDSIALADSYASSAALHLALTSAPTQLWANDEFGRYLKVAASANGSGAHDYGIITMAMKLHTMFEKFLPTKVYSQGSNRERVDHPLLVAMHTTTPKALFDSMDSAAVVDGMLGRLLVIQQEGRPALKLLQEKSAEQLSADIATRISYEEDYVQKCSIARLMPQTMHVVSDDKPFIAPSRYLSGLTNHRFIPISADVEALPHFEPIRQDCDMQAETNSVAAALWSRAYEQILRIAGVVAFGQAVWDGTLDNPKISLTNLLWARDLVYWSLQSLVPAAQEHASDSERDKLQKSILANLRKLTTSAPSGWVEKRDLLQLIKGRGRNHRELKEEISALIECGDIEVQIGDDGAPARPAMLRCIV